MLMSLPIRYAIICDVKGGNIMRQYMFTSIITFLISFGISYLICKGNFDNALNAAFTTMFIMILAYTIKSAEEK